VAEALVAEETRVESCSLMTEDKPDVSDDPEGVNAKVQINPVKQKQVIYHD